MMLTAMRIAGFITVLAIAVVGVGSAYKALATDISIILAMSFLIVVVAALSVAVLKCEKWLLGE